MSFPQPVEQALVKYLAPLGQVGTRVPQARPASFVRVTRSGGSTRSVGQSDVQVLVECFGSSESLAWGLVRDAWRMMLAADVPDELPGGVEVMRVNLTEPVNYPDASTTAARYQFVASLTVNLKE